nr:MAG TPA: hypothetical protein [Caudoviricetes sp.]
MQSKLFAARIATFGIHGISKENHAAVLILLLIIPMLYIPSQRIFVVMQKNDKKMRFRRNMQCFVLKNHVRLVQIGAAFITSVWIPFIQM